MSASSIHRKVAEKEKAKKVERRNALIKRYESENDIVKHIKTEERGIPAETVSGDSIIDSGEVKVTPAPKAKAKKASGSKKGGNSKKVLSDSKATKI
jgi:hypothetical protein|tara:strand:+ start:219 stop:509 length:291 start_codon:yes stop_codon:yes gene_type:complete